jgi:hypothetical protein
MVNAGTASASDCHVATCSKPARTIQALRKPPVRLRFELIELPIQHCSVEHRTH